MNQPSSGNRRTMAGELRIYAEPRAMMCNRFAVKSDPPRARSAGR
jgi:hypothetical protein